jgi:hypothetical protein
MSNQIVISSGAKVRALEGVLTGTAGIVNALGINVPNGIPQLDGSGKILVSQLPNSVMEYKGTWNAATNTPTLVNGTGNQGDVYLCNVAGTVDFGAGPIVFFVGDQVIYSGTIWQRASGASGTVTSVAVTETGDALTITGSPITTSGTINIGFAGTSGQYINGAGGLTTFPSLAGYVTGTGTTNYLSKFTSASDIGNSLVYDNGTNVIIGNGTTDIQGRLQVTTSAGALLLNTDNINFAILFRNTASSNKLWDISSFNNDLVFNEGGVGSRLYLKAGGDVGIGNTTPAYKLDVSGTGRFTGELRLESTITNGTFTYTLPAATGTLALTSNLSSYVPYTGATANVNLGTFDLTADVITGATGSFASSGGSNTFAINHSSGSGIALNITKGGNGEGLYINKTSGSGNAATIIGTLNATTLVKSGGTSSQYLMADGSVSTLTNPVTGTGLNGAIPKFTTTGSTIGSSIIFDSGTQIGINTLSPSFTLDVNGTARVNGVLTLSSTISNGTYTYTFPASTGTIALTSNLSAYLPLSGGTLTGALTGTSATFSGKVLINTVTDVQGALQVNTNGGGLLVNSDNSNFAILFRNTSSSNKLWDFSSFNNDFTINEGGVATRMYFQAGGNVGIGTTTPSAKLSVVGDVAFSSSGIANGTTKFSVAGAGLISSFGSAGSATDNYIRFVGNANNFDVGITGTSWGVADAGVAYRLIVTQTGNVGIGTSSPLSFTSYTTAQISNTAGGGLFVESTTGGIIGQIVADNGYAGGAAVNIGSRSNHPLVFTTNNTERMRITSGGNVCIGTTSGSSALNVQYDGNTFNAITTRPINSYSAAAINFLNISGTSVGYILPTAVATAYVTTSDYRLKQDFKDYKGLDLINSIKTYDYEWKSNKSRMYGVMAHELQEVIPYAVHGEKDGEQMQGVDYSKLVPILVKAIQELKLEIDELKNK